MARERVLKGEQVEQLPRRRRAPAWDFSQVADGKPYLLRRGRDFDVKVDTIRVAAKQWAREQGLEVATRSEFDAPPGQRRKKVGLYVQFGPRRS
ncbi:MAG: hypothetical protein ACM3UV_07340 [Nocardioidaceae bacterium]